MSSPAAGSIADTASGSATAAATAADSSSTATTGADAVTTGQARLKRRLLAFLVIERAGLGKHSERTDGIRTKADVAGGIAIELGLGLGRDRLLRRLGSGNLVIELFGLDSLILILGHDGANQRLVGRRTLKALDLLVESSPCSGSV